MPPRDLFTRILGPVGGYEAARVGRRRATFVVRGAYVVAVAALLGGSYLAWRDTPAGGPDRAPPARLAAFARGFFELFVAAQFAAVAVVTPALTAGAVVEERERRTLDFLLVTGLSAREVVAGKLAVRVGQALLLVLAGLPVLAFLQFFGGVDPELLVTAFALTLVTAVGLAGLGVGASGRAVRSRDAVVTAYTLAVTYVVLTGVAYRAGVVAVGQGMDHPTTVLGTRVSGAELARWAAAGNPLVAADRLTAGGGPATRREWWAVVGGYAAFHLFVAAAGVATAAAQLRPSARAGRPDAAGGWRAAWRRPGRRPAVGDRPVLWREVFAAGDGVRGRDFALAAAYTLALLPLVVLTLRLVNGRPLGAGAWHDATWRESAFGVTLWVRGVTAVFGTLMLLRAVVRGAGAITGERERDTWDSLLATPVTAGEIAWGKWWGAALGGRRLGYGLGVAWAVGLAAGAVAPLSAAATAAALAVYLWAFAWWGLFCSATAASTWAATARAVAGAAVGVGGFWLPVGCGLAGRGFGAEGGLLAGMTPPLVLATATFDPQGPVTGDAVWVRLGTCVWLAVGAALAGLTLARVGAITNRGPVTVDPVIDRMSGRGDRRA